jgi:uncharacterized protein YhfF
LAPTILASRLADVDRATAESEGEGYVNVDEWRRSHEAFWERSAEDLRLRLGDALCRLGDDTRVVVEQFRLVDRLTT